MTHPRATSSAPPVFADDSRLVEALRRGDEDAFEWLVRAHNQALLRFAGRFLRDRAVAEEVVQETWLVVVRGISSFEGRSSVKTWVFNILANRARSRAERESRSRPFSACLGSESDDDRSASGIGPAMPEGVSRVGSGWAGPIQPWNSPEASFLAAETRGLIEGAIATLPTVQRQVITSRDLVGMDAREVCQAMGLTDGNQRVLLHRARTGVRRALGTHLDPRRAPVGAPV